MFSEAAIVFVVDDNLSVRRSTERLLRSAGLEVQTFASAEDFLKAPRPDRPACIVLDVRMPGLSGIELQRELFASGFAIPIIFVTARGDISIAVIAMKAGALDFLTKPFRSRTLLDAVESALLRDQSERKDRTEMEELRRRYENLTPRERQVMRLVAAGFLNKQVGSKLSTTERTIKFHRAHLMKKMRAQSLADLVKTAGKLGLSSSVE